MVNFDTLSLAFQLGPDWINNRKIPQSLTTRQPVNVLRILEQVCGITSLRFLKYLTSVGPLSYRQYSYKKNVYMDLPLFHFFEKAIFEWLLSLFD